MKTMVFEKLHAAYYLLVRYYLWRGYRVVFFDFEQESGKIGWVRRLRFCGKLHRVYVLPNMEVHGQAIDLVESIVSNGKRKGLAGLLAKLFETEDARLILKKQLVEEIFPCLYMHYYLTRRAGEDSRPGEIGFLPENCMSWARYLRRYGNYHLDPLPASIKQYWFHRLLVWPVVLGNRAKGIGAFLYLVTALCALKAGRLFRRPAPGVREARYAISLDQVFQVKFTGARSFDFLLDGKTLTKENTVFIKSSALRDWPGRRYEEHTFVDEDRFGTLRTMLCHAYSGSFVERGFAACRLLLVLIPFLPASLLWKSMAVLYVFLRWNVLCQHVRFDHYVYTNKEGYSQTAVNLVLRGYGVKTWNYASSTGLGYRAAMSRDGFGRCRHIIWSFLCSDYFVAVNEDNIEYQKLHHQQVGSYVNLGSIWSEAINGSVLALDRAAFLKEHYGADVPADRKVVSFFDTTYIPDENSPSPTREATVFYGEILRLIDEWPELLVIVKPSKDDAIFISPDYLWSSPEGEGIVGLRNNLRKHPRCYFANHSADPSDIIAVSDAVVTYCFSSPTVDALGSKKRAFWYEVSNRWKVNFFRDIPALVVHGYDNLKERLRCLLFETTDQEYDRYLERHINGRVVANLECSTLTRFRELLKA